jgi:acetyl esterase
MNFEAKNVEHLDRDSQAVVDALNAAGASRLGLKTPDEVRDWIKTNFESHALDPKPQVAKIENFTILRNVDSGSADIPVRLYRPFSRDNHLLPVLVFFHAGGYIFGDLEFLDDFCRWFARDAGCLVLSVDYRRAPEQRFPVPIEDCYAATLWAAEHAEEFGGDPQRLAVGGDSSGGTLAIVVAQMAIERGKPYICHQFLWYPGVGSEGPTASAGDFAEGYFLENGLIAWSMKHYLPADTDVNDPRIQPLKYDRLAELPPTFLMTAGFDPRRDDNLLYAQRLASAGVATEFRCVDSTIHGFLFMLGGIQVARDALADSAKYARGVFTELSNSAT